MAFTPFVDELMPFPLVAAESTAGLGRSHPVRQRLPQHSLRLRRRHAVDSPGCRASTTRGCAVCSTKTPPPCSRRTARSGDRLRLRGAGPAQPLQEQRFGQHDVAVETLTRQRVQCRQRRALDSGLRNQTGQWPARAGAASVRNAHATARVWLSPAPETSAAVQTSRTGYDQIAASVFGSAVSTLTPYAAM